MRKAYILYELFMFLLVLISIFLIFNGEESYIFYDRIIWVVFVIDYFFKFFRSKNKWHYVKKHPLELIAIIPFDALFKAARIVRIFRIIRLLSIGAHFFKPFYGLLKTNGLDRVIIMAIVLLFIIPIPIIIFEPSINTFQDALWWAIVTTTTVGYGDISPETPIGRLLAVVLMLTGIGIIGALTSSITSYFSSENNSNKPTEDRVFEIIKLIEETDDLKEEDAELIRNHLERKRIRYAVNQKT
ncbi:potassium channel family protein [Jeotgalibacillus salarius]|uniref:Two pore domain potassium channel family protein n=1 Tax=Jeotgalibacillus salarius TaxID=546023 RepID=A0A4Y8LIQ2_9BACL|nr:potassium channel family protein [Jeotgalibacillus salarius]TFE01571.1 two pore domain potassium channel family protein [Jeotgalibacillus salarius]